MKPEYEVNVHTSKLCG